MSTSTASTTKPVAESPPVAQAGQPLLTEPKVAPAEQIVSVEEKLTPIGELNTTAETTVMPTDIHNIPTEEKPTLSGEQNVAEPETKPEPLSSPKVQEKVEEIVEKTSEIVKIEDPKKETPQERIENVENINVKGEATATAETKNPGQEPAYGAVASGKNEVAEEVKNTATKQEQEKAKSKLELDKPATDGEKAKGQDSKANNPEANGNEDTSECINVQELTEHVMNILNDETVGDVMTEQHLLKKNVDLQQFIVKLIQLLKEKTDLCANLDRQNSALISQAQSLKDVIAITKDLLGIRNMEIEHLHADLTCMEDTIKEERKRHNLSVQRLGEAMALNDKLKTEYLNQMDLFQKLRDKYNEKIVFLTRENQRLNGLVNGTGPTAEVTPDESNASDLESSQTESVDK